MAEGVHHAPLSRTVWPNTVAWLNRCSAVQAELDPLATNAVSRAQSGAYSLSQGLLPPPTPSIFAGLRRQRKTSPSPRSSTTSTVILASSSLSCGTRGARRRAATDRPHTAVITVLDCSVHTPTHYTTMQ